MSAGRPARSAATGSWNSSKVERAADRLVPDDPVVGAEHVAVAEARAVEQPVVVRGTRRSRRRRAASRRRSGGTARTPSPPPSTAHSGRPTSGSAHIPVISSGRPSATTGSSSWAVYLWQTMSRRRVVLQPDLPEHRVAGEAGEVAAPLDVGLHRPRWPADQYSSWPTLTRGRSRRARPGPRRGRTRPRSRTRSRRLGPLDEPPLVGEPSGGADRRRVRVVGAVLLEDQPVGVGFLAPPNRPGLAVVAVDLGRHSMPAAERPRERHLVAAGVQLRAAPRVVGVPRVGSEHEQRRGVSLRRGAHDEAGVADVSPGHGAVRGEGDEVEAGAPVGADRDLDRRRPRAAVGVGVGRRRRERASSPWRSTPLPVAPQRSTRTS